MNETSGPTMTDERPPADGNPVAGPRSGRRLRRSSTNRVGAGVCAGFGDYFGVDPVLFRVLFATAAFFGGAGILAYVLAWAVIPEAGTEQAPIDGWVGELRRRRIPPWIVVVIGGLLLWGVAFSWWAPGPFLPVVAVVVVLAIVFGRREWQRSSTPPDPHATDGTAPTIDLTKADPAATPSATTVDAGAAAPLPQPGGDWAREARAWFEESRAAHRARRRRVLPVKVATLGTLGAALIVLAIVDSTTGIALQVYFWTALAIVVAGLLVGVVLRRAPWSVATLIPLLAAGAIAFAGSSTQLGDGIGQHEWRPTAAPATHYRLAFGQAVLDLTRLPAQTQARRVDVRLGAGQVKIIAPPSMNVTVNAHIHIGALEIHNAAGGQAGATRGGVGFNRTVDPPTGATGAPITVDVQLADGNVTVQR